MLLFVSSPVKSNFVILSSYLMMVGSFTADAPWSLFVSFGVSSVDVVSFLGIFSIKMLMDGLDFPPWKEEDDLLHKLVCDWNFHSGLNHVYL